MGLSLHLADRNDCSLLSTTFQQCGRIHIPSLLEQKSADSLLGFVENYEGWSLVFNSGDRHVDIYSEQLALMTSDQIQEAHRIAKSGAQKGFQYLFKNYPIYDAYHEGICPKPLSDLYEFLNSPSLLDFVREITGHGDIAFADAQLTKFEAGHFLTTHDDNIEGKDRRAAFVLNLTPDWKADWGGLLQFFGEDDHIEGGFTPSFNALNIFSIPKPHAVSLVAPFAKGARYSVTGWFRAGKDPKRS